MNHTLAPELVEDMVRELTWRIEQGEAISLLRTLPDESVDAVITDPPYSSGGAMRGDRMQGTSVKYQNTGAVAHPEFLGDTRDQRGYLAWSQLWLSEALRVTRPGGVVAVFSDWRQIGVTTDAVQAGGWVWRGLVPWVKPGARPQSGRFTAAAEYVVWGSKGPMPFDGHAPVHPGWVECRAPRPRQHAAEKPLELMRVLVRICPEGGTVLDPFAGTGTTGVAALTEGRRFIGFELSPHFVDVASERLAGAIT